MHILTTVLLAVIGTSLLFASWVFLRSWARMRRHGKPTVGTVVGHEKTRNVDSATPWYSAVFEFTTEDGRTVRSVGSATRSRRREIGQEIPIVYHPADPEGTADRPGAQHRRLALSPAFLVCGTALIVLAVQRLLS